MQQQELAYGCSAAALDSQLLFDELMRNDEFTMIRNDVADLKQQLGSAIAGMTSHHVSTAEMFAALTREIRALSGRLGDKLTHDAQVESLRQTHQQTVSELEQYKRAHTVLVEEVKRLRVLCGVGPFPIPMTVVSPPPPPPVG